jgi:hypothetical protein
MMFRSTRRQTRPAGDLAFTGWAVNRRTGLSPALWSN